MGEILDKETYIFPTIKFLNTMNMMFVLFGVCMFFFTLNIERESSSEWTASLFFMIVPPILLASFGLTSPYQIDVDHENLYFYFYGKPKKIAWEEITEFKKSSVFHPLTLIMNDSYFLPSKQFGLFNRLFGIFYFKLSPIIFISPRTPEHYRLVKIKDTRINQKNAKSCISKSQPD